MKRELSGGLLTLCCAMGTFRGPAASGAVNLLDPVLNNPSFESPDVFFVLNNSVTNWKCEGPLLPTDNPLAGPGPVGVGVFDNLPGPQFLGNADGAQVGYIFSHSLPNNFPDYAPTDPFIDHAISHVATNLTYQAGQQYMLSIAFALASTPPPVESELTFSLFATDNPLATNGTVLASRTMNSTEPALNQASLEFFSTFTLSPIAGDAVGKFIGIRISTHTDPEDLIGFTGGGQFDFDKVMVQIVPEPSSAALLAAGALGLLSARRRR